MSEHTLQSQEIRPTNILVEDFAEAIQKVASGEFSKPKAFPIIAIYESPSDQPGKYVARLWATDVPTRYAAIRDSLEDVRKTIPGFMINVGRNPEDDPHIVEIWI